MSKLIILKQENPENKKRACIACGRTDIDGRRRYCSQECRRQIMWVLSLSNGLLSIFNTRYASFSFSSAQVVLDILPAWSKEISRFTHKRTPGRKRHALHIHQGRKQLSWKGRSSFTLSYIQFIKERI